jgi:MraZ protein
MPTKIRLPFLSTYSGSLDDKGRLSIPADYRNALSPESERHIVLSFGNANFINAFPLDFFNTIWESGETDNIEFASLSSLERDTLLLGESVIRKIDDQGRITLPQSLVKQVNMNRDVIFMGRRTHFTIWDSAGFEEHRRQLKITAGDAWQRLIDSRGKKS